MVTASEVGGGVAIEEHLMELGGKMTQSILTLFCLTFETFEGVAVAEIPVSRLTRFGFEIVSMCLTVFIVRIVGLVE